MPKDSRSTHLWQISKKSVDSALFIMESINCYGFCTPCFKGIINTCFVLKDSFQSIYTIKLFTTLYCTWQIYISRMQPASVTVNIMEIYNYDKYRSIVFIILFKHYSRQSCLLMYCVPPKHNSISTWVVIYVMLSQNNDIYLYVLFTMYYSLFSYTTKL